jgi:hypothetical protein
MPAYDGKPSHMYVLCQAKISYGHNYRVRRQFCKRLSTGYRGLLWRRMTIESTLRVL